MPFVNEFPTRIAPLLRMPAIVDMNPEKDRLLICIWKKLEIYLPNDKLLKGKALHRLFVFQYSNSFNAKLDTCRYNNLKKLYRKDLEIEFMDSCSACRILDC